VQRGWYDRKSRRGRDLACGDLRIYLEVEVRRVVCRRCGKVKQKRPAAFLADDPFYTKRFAFYVGRRCRASPIRDVSKELRLEWHTVKALEQQYMREQLRRAGTPSPQVIWIDEVSMRGVVGGGGRILARLVARMSMDKAERYQSGFEHLDRTLAALYRERPRRIVVSALVHALAWAGGGLELYLVLRLQGTPAPLVTTMVIESFAAAVKFASFMVPASLGALEGGVVVFFEAFGLSGAAGLSYVLIRRLREAVWAGIGFVLLTGWDRQTALGGSDSP
jgi:hypothetical protein